MTYYVCFVLEKRNLFFTQHKPGRFCCFLFSPPCFFLWAISGPNPNLVPRQETRTTEESLPAEVCYFGVKQYKPKVITEALVFQEVAPQQKFWSQRLSFVEGDFLLSTMVNHHYTIFGGIFFQRCFSILWNNSTTTIRK